MGGSLSSLRTQLGIKLQDTGFEYYGGNNTEANWSINQGLKYVSTIAPFAMIGTLQGIQSDYAIVSGTTQYDLPTDFLHLNKVRVDLDGNGLTWCTKILLENLDSTDNIDFRTPTFARPICYLNEGKINYLPAPSASSVSPHTDSVDVYYVKEATDLSADTDPSPMSALLDHAIILYACATMASKAMDSDRWFKALDVEMSRWGGKSQG